MSDVRCYSPSVLVRMDHTMPPPVSPATPRGITPLGITVLALLVEDDMHPYEMLRLLEQRRRDRIVSVTKGSVYHTVARLEAHGYIAEVGVDREGNRPERTRYSVLALGRDTLPAWVAEELPRIDRPTAFRVALAEAHNLPLAQVVELLTVRCDGLREQLVALQSGITAAHTRGTPDQFLIEFERECALLNADLSWNTTLLERLSTTPIPWGEDGHSDPAQYALLRKAAQL